MSDFSGQTYLLALTRLKSACEARSGTRMVGLNKSGSGCGSGSRDANERSTPGARHHSTEFRRKNSQVRSP